jgi:peptidoglycan glycosyltransferase
MTKRRILFFSLVVILLAAALPVLSWIQVRRAAGDWRTGRIGDALERAQSWSRLGIFSRQYEQVIAASLLGIGQSNQARSHLGALGGGGIWFPAIHDDEVARRLFARGAYEDFLEYDAASREHFERNDLVLYRAAALLATGKIAEAEKAAGEIESKKVDATKLLALQHAIEARKQGTFPFVFDRNGQVIAQVSASSNDVVAVNKDFESLIDSAAGSLTIEARVRDVSDPIETTLDPAIQRAAMAALGGFRGAIVAIDPRTNEILAVATNAVNGPESNIALEGQFEPGSVIKVLTILAASSNGVDLSKLFPYDCKGQLASAGPAFTDWVPGGHGVLPDIDEALAESCNIVFGDIGIRTGFPRLKALHKLAGFDGQVDLGLFRVPLGRTTARTISNYDIASHSIGLGHESITTLHLAMLASMMANRGVLTTPRIYRTRRSILGEPLHEAPAQASVTVAPKAAAELAVHAMQAVASSEKGTGRRAAIDGVTLALKTGTSGSRAPGYDALIMGFTPVENPKIAFALIAPGSGPAEFAAAKIAHDFLVSLNHR